MLNKKLISIIALVSLVFSTNLVTPAKADSINYAADRLSTSNNGASATHYVSFMPTKSIAASDFFQIDLPALGGTVSDAGKVTCPGGMSASVVGAPSRQIKCTLDSGTYNPATTTITIVGVANPVGTSSYAVKISSITAGTLAVKESVEVRIAIVGTVVVSANVPSSLTFNVLSLPQNTLINGASTTAASATTSLQFGTLQVGTSSIMGQQLEVATNANYGYKVTVEQNQDMTSNSGATIDSFLNGAAPAAPITWAGPTGTLDSKNTYGHMGFTTDDASLSSTTPALYQGSKWMGFTGTSTQEVMYHTGAADGTTQDKGLVKVAYRIQVTALQEAGDYTNILTYVATPTF